MLCVVWKLRDFCLFASDYLMKFGWEKKLKNRLRKIAPVSAAAVQSAWRKNWSLGGLVETKLQQQVGLGGGCYLVGQGDLRD